MKEPICTDRSCPIYEADRSLTFLTRANAPSESALTVWAAIALLFVLAMLAFGGPS